MPSSSRLSPGSYYHFGIESGLVRQFSMLGIKSFKQSVISIYVGIDGVSLSKSSKSTFWIIAGFMDQIITARSWQSIKYRISAVSSLSNSFLETSFNSPIIQLKFYNSWLFENKNPQSYYAKEVVKYAE